MESNEPNIDLTKDEHEEKNKKKIYFDNVFSKMEKSDKSKRYVKLVNDLNLLEKDVKLLEDYVNRDKYGKKKKFKSGKIPMLNNNQSFGMNARKYNNLKFRKKMNMRYSISPNQRNINTEGNINDNSFKNNNSKNKINNRSNLNLIYKTEISKVPKLINGNKLPKIIFGSDKNSDSNLDANSNIIDQSDSSRLPIIKNKYQNLNIEKNKNKLNLLTEGNVRQESKNFSKIYNRLYVPKKSININDNSFIKKYPTILNSHRIKSGINRQELSQSTDKEVRRMKEKNMKIKNKINYKLAEQDLVDWEMKSKIKLAQWKFGIAEIEKYFVDLRAYGKPEEEELLKRKTFYDIVEDLIDEIKKEKEEKDINQIKNKYNKDNNNGKDNEKKDEEKNNDINMVKNAINKQNEMSEVLKKVKKRKLKEERTRHLIDGILVQSELRRRFINNSTNKLYNKEDEINYDNNGEKKEIKIKKEYQINNKDNKGGILIKEKEDEDEEEEDEI